jgi:hypothetical protein
MPRNTPRRSTAMTRSKSTRPRRRFWNRRSSASADWVLLVAEQGQLVHLLAGAQPAGDGGHSEEAFLLRHGAAEAPFGDFRGLQAAILQSATGDIGSHAEAVHLGQGALLPGKGSRPGKPQRDIDVLEPHTALLGIDASLDYQYYC